MRRLLARLRASELAFTNRGLWRSEPSARKASVLTLLLCPAAGNELDLALDVYRQMLAEGCTPNLVSAAARPAPPLAALPLGWARRLDGAARTVSMLLRELL